MMQSLGARPSDVNNDGQIPLPKTSRWPLIIVLLVSIAPIAAAYISFFGHIGIPEKSVNHGAMITHPISAKKLVGIESNVNWTSRKWRLLIPVSQDCNNVCENHLYITRQVHTRLGAKANRVERVLVFMNAVSPVNDPDTLKLPHIVMRDADWQAWLNEAHVTPAQRGQGFYLLLDQRGVSVMIYNESHSGNDLLKDIKRALKYSIDYRQ